MAKKSEINIKIETDDNHVPEKMSWTAQDGKVSDKEAKAMLLSLWDPNQKESFRIDLWTKDMPLDEMKTFFYQTLIAMSDTFYRATDDEKMTETMRDFCAYYADKMNIK